MSKEAFNQATGLLTIVPLTSLKAGRKLYPNEVLLPAAIAGPPADSIALCHQIRTISGARAYSMVGRLTDGGLRQRIAEALLDHLELVDLDLLTEEP